MQAKAECMQLALGTSSAIIGLHGTTVHGWNSPEPVMQQGRSRLRTGALGAKPPTTTCALQHEG